MEKTTKELTLKELQQEETKILAETVKFLDKHKLKYSLLAGTLLGAVRHKGFIPWDDDIDLAMPREDMDKLIELFKKNDGVIGKNLRAIGYELNKTSWFPFLKIVNKDISVECEGGDFDKNLWIDIFPIDGYVESEKYDKKLQRIKNLYMRIRSYMCCKRSDNNVLKYVVKKLIAKIIRIDHVTKKLIKISKKYKYEDCMLVCANTWGIGRKESFPKTLFDDLIDYDFEDIKVKAFKDAHIWLGSRYGDYMTLPPENQRMTHKIIARKVNNDK